jgi:hypothetical protein
MTDIQALNAIITQLGGTTAYLYNIQAYNAWSVLQGGVGTYTRDIDALNAIDVLNGGSGGHRYNINALNSIDVAAGGTGGHTLDISALTSLGTLLNQTAAPGISGVAASLVSDTGFTVSADIAINGAETTVTIEYGLTNAYGSTQATVTGSPLAADGAISAVFSGLAQNTTYHYRVVATNSAGTTNGADQTQATTNVRWILPITGRTSGTATAGTLVFTCSEDITPTVTGDVTISVARANDPSASLRKHTLTVNCPNDGSGTIIIPDRSKVLSLGNHNGPSNPNIDLYTGTNATAPILALNLDNIPATILKIRFATAYANILPASGSSALPTGLTYLNLTGDNINWTYSGALPTGLTIVSLSGNNINWTYSGALPIGLTLLIFISTSINWTYSGALPTGLTYLYLSGNNINWTYSGALPTGLTYLYLIGTNINWTGLGIGNNGNIGLLALANYRITKMSSDDMITLLTQLTNRTGTLPTTITINDYADYASPPAGVVTAVNTLKATKSITTVNLGA